MRFLHLVSEDHLSESIAEKIIRQFTDYEVYCIQSRGGRSYIEKRLLAYNRSAKKLSFFVIVDLDQNPCAGDYIKQHFGRTTISPNMIFRIAVREVESWILADQRVLVTILKYQNKSCLKLQISYRTPNSTLWRL